MKGVSEVIAIILILMITIAIAGLAYTFMSSTMASTTSAASSAVDTTTSSMLTSFTIENMDIAKVYVRNTGQIALLNLSVYVNDEPAIYSLAPATIAAGQVGTVTIYSFIPDRATVKITSPNGFSTSNVANPCSKAVGCWNFDEVSGTVAYDSSPHGNTGALVSGPTWTVGRYGSGLLFDGVNDYVNAGNHDSLNLTDGLSLCAWFRNTLTGTSYQPIAAKSDDSRVGYGLLFRTNGLLTFYLNTTSFYGNEAGPTLASNTWYYVCGIWSGSTASIYVDGTSVYSRSHGGVLGLDESDFYIGRWAGYYFNGIIDEVRLFNRAIY